VSTANEYYQSLLKEIKEEGQMDRNPRPKYKDGTPAYTRFITLPDSFKSNGKTPLVTLRPTATFLGINEMRAFFQLQTNKIEDFHKLGIHYWDEWDIGDGTIGDRYGETVRKYDLTNKLLTGLVNDPYGRRHIIDLYQYKDFEETPGLFPCVFLNEWLYREVDGVPYLDLFIHQRSSDTCTSWNINVIQYYAMQLMVACHCGYEVGKLKYTIGNAHTYDRHFEAVDEILNRTAPEEEAELILTCPKGTNFYDITIDDFKVINYNPIKPQLKFELAI
jgi:thymidylate synthase